MGNTQLAFSTAWLGEAAGRADAVIQAADSLGLHQVSLDPVPKGDPPEVMRKAFFRERLKVVALRGTPVLDPSSEADLPGGALSDPRPDRQAQAITYFLEGAKVAKALGAEKMMINLGAMKHKDLIPIHDALWEETKKSGHTQAARDLMVRGRALVDEILEPYLDRIIRALYRLLKEEGEIIFCIENRPALYELPDLKSLAYLFEDLRSPRLRYWHNTGYAHVQEQLGWVHKNAWLGEYAPWMAGIHLHDVHDLKTHLPPGAGTLDFTEIMEAIPKEASRVIDLDPDTPLEEFKIGLDTLRAFGI
jgi:sugar phosphate isomerase/epimerase